LAGFEVMSPLFFSHSRNTTRHGHAKAVPAARRRSTGTAKTQMQQQSYLPRLSKPFDSPDHINALFSFLLCSVIEKDRPISTVE
jgi:hypothetical protein